MEDERIIEPISCNSSNIREAVETVAQRYNEKVTLFPQVTYEDLGAGYWFVFEEKMYPSLLSLVMVL